MQPTMMSLMGELSNTMCNTIGAIDAVSKTSTIGRITWKMNAFLGNPVALLAKIMRAQKAKQAKKKWTINTEYGAPPSFNTI